MSRTEPYGPGSTRMARCVFTVLSRENLAQTNHPGRIWIGRTRLKTSSLRILTRLPLAQRALIGPAVPGRPADPVRGRGGPERQRRPRPDGTGTPEPAHRLLTRLSDTGRCRAGYLPVGKRLPRYIGLYGARWTARNGARTTHNPTVPRAMIQGTSS